MSCCRRTWATTARWRFRSRRRSTGKWVRSGVRAWASATRSFGYRWESRIAMISSPISRRRSPNRTFAVRRGRMNSPLCKPYRFVALPEQIGLRKHHGFAPFRVDAQVASRIVPIGEHVPLAGSSVDDVLVPRRAVRMTVDQARDAMLTQRRRDRVGVDVHDQLGFARGRTPAARAEQGRDAAADDVGQRQQPPAMDRILPVRAKALIIDVVGAELVAVHDQRGRAVEVVDY